MISPSEIEAAEREVASPFERWNEVAAVRVKVDRYDCTGLTHAECGSKQWFVPGALALLEHPALKELGADACRRMQAHYLVFFLGYTTLLEHRVVNRSAEVVAQDALPLSFTHGIREDALRLYTDEGYHALISATLARQVAELLELGPVPRANRRVDRIEQWVKDLPAGLQPLGSFLAGFVSETVITKEFMAFSNAAMVTPVYHVLRDHLEDEWLHARYFSNVFSYVWSRLDHAHRDIVGQLLPEIIEQYFVLDERWIEASMVEVGVRPTTAREIALERCTPEAVRERARKGATATLHALRRSGFFDDRSRVESFTSRGLLP
jgi:hypothetical protein